MDLVRTKIPPELEAEIIKCFEAGQKAPEILRSEEPIGLITLAKIRKSERGQSWTKLMRSFIIQSQC